jgi:hypothetical protein
MKGPIAARTAGNSHCSLPLPLYAGAVQLTWTAVGMELCCDFDLNMSALFTARLLRLYLGSSELTAKLVLAER